MSTKLNPEFVSLVRELVAYVVDNHGVEFGDALEQHKSPVMAAKALEQAKNWKLINIGRMIHSTVDGKRITRTHGFTMWPTTKAVPFLTGEYDPQAANGAAMGSNAANATTNGADSVTDPALLAQFANLLDDTAIKVLTIIQDGERSVDDKLRLLSALDVRHYGKASKPLADLLGVTEQAIRKTKWWKVDRHQNV